MNFKPMEDHIFGECVCLFKGVNETCVVFNTSFRR